MLVFIWQVILSAHLPGHPLVHDEFACDPTTCSRFIIRLFIWKTAPVLLPSPSPRFRLQCTCTLYLHNYSWRDPWCTALLTCFSFFDFFPFILVKINIKSCLLYLLASVSLSSSLSAFCIVRFFTLSADLLDFDGTVCLQVFFLVAFTGPRGWWGNASGSSEQETAEKRRGKAYMYIIIIIIITSWT